LVIALDVEALVMFIVEPFLAVNVPEFTIELVPVNVSAVLSIVKLPAVAPLFWLVITVGLPLQFMVQDVNNIVAPVLVIDAPATIINAVFVAANVLFILLVNEAVFPVNLKFEAPLTTIMPELVITALLLVNEDEELATIEPALLIMVPLLKFKADAVSFILPVKVFVNVTGLPVPLLVVLPGSLVDMPVAEFDLRLPLLVNVALEPNAKAPLNIVVHRAPMVNVDKVFTDDAPPKVTWLVPAN
jgi:hypothetical protein